MRAQVSADFLIATVIAFAIFSILLGLYVTRVGVFQEMEKKVVAERNAYRIAAAINAVSEAPDGTEVVMRIDFDEPHLIRFVERRVEIFMNSTGDSVSAPVLANLSFYETDANEVRIANENGSVVVR
ncbi:MAG: hypothetical protein QXP42_05615 [Candidatus Micrarchaeia archaeon]